MSNGGGIENRGTISIANSDLAHNSSDGTGSTPRGGGLNNSKRGIATIINSKIDSNTSNYGGGIANSNELEIRNSTISGNTSKFGGGIANSISLGIRYRRVSYRDYRNSHPSNVITKINNSTINNNSATYGGGIASTESLIVNNSTIGDNSALIGGGLHLFNYLKTKLRSSTITGNSASAYGSGINNSNTFGVDSFLYDFGETYLSSTIVAKSSQNHDLSGIIRFISEGHNPIGNGDRNRGGFVDGVNDDLVGTGNNPIDPLLGQLRDNGGETLTDKLLTGSPAINTGSNPLLRKTDRRLDGFDRVVGSSADIGAYETQTIFGTSDDDTLTGNEKENKIDSLAGNDLIFGVSANDIELGQSGNDTLNGGGGNNTLTGGSDKDVFVLQFLSGSDGDIISDFTDGVDLLSSSSGLSFASLTIIDSDTSTQIFDSQHHLLATLFDVDSSSIDLNDFVTT